MARSATDPTRLTGPAISEEKWIAASLATSAVVEPGAVAIPAWSNPSSNSNQAPTASSAGSSDRRERRRPARRAAARPGPAMARMARTPNSAISAVNHTGMWW